MSQTHGAASMRSMPWMDTYSGPMMLLDYWAAADAKARVEQASLDEDGNLHEEVVALA